MAKRIPRKVAARRAYYYLLGVHDQHTAHHPTMDWNEVDLHLPFFHDTVGRKTIRGGLLRTINALLLRKGAGFKIVNRKGKGNYTLKTL